MSRPQYSVYPVGTPGQPWGAEERDQWRSLQTKKRDYFNDVVSALARFTHVDVFQYGELDYRKYGAAKFPLFAVKSKQWDASRPLAIITGGVHGYETSGVHGALLFIASRLAEYQDRVNVLVLPCISPWGYETVNRWNPEAIDPNRSFHPATPGCGEAAFAMAAIAEHVKQSASVLLHVDLHETTDTDNSEFTPAKTARDGAPTPEWDPIPDGFYLVNDEDRHDAAWSKVIIDAVAKVTHIAEPDERGTIIGEKIAQHGVVSLPGANIGLCGAHVDARFRTTTEVYPDSPRATPEQCNVAQCTVVTAGLDYALSH